MNKINKVSTGNLAPKRTTAPLKGNDLDKLISVLPVADQAALSNSKATPVSFPQVFSKLAARDQQALRDLPADVALAVLDKVPANPQAAKIEISNRLLQRAASLVPGEGVQFGPKELFRVSDAAIALQTLSQLSPADRARLEGVSFNRVPHSTFDESHMSRETDGAAVVEIDHGKGWLGKLAFKFAALLEKLALTAPIALALKAWFPHALAEYRSRVIEIGDAQAERMREVLTHEIGHQVQFGPGIDTDYAGMAEWAKLSGWKDTAAGGAAYGLDDSGQVRALSANIRPTRSDNFVYDNFAADLSPQALNAALDEIKDPELKREFATTTKVKANLQAAIKEVFGVEAKGYSMVNPLEDFAESFRAFYQDPQLLVAKAPDKFLFINAQSKRFAPHEVQELFKQAGKNPKTVATGLVKVGLTQETVDRIFKANGVTADARSLGQAAAVGLRTARKTNQTLPAFQEAFMTIQQKAAEGNLAFISAFTQDPAKALGTVWNRLSAAEKAQFSDEGKRVEVVQKMQRGTMSDVSAAAQGYRDIEVTAIRNFGTRLMDDAGFRKTLRENPQQALAGAARNMPPTLRTALTDPTLQASWKTFAATVDKLIKLDEVPLLGGGDLKKMFEENLKTMDESMLQASIGTLRDDPARMAEVFCGLSVVEVNGIKVPPAG